MRRIIRSIFVLVRRGLAVVALAALLVAGLRAVQAMVRAARLDARLTQPVDDPVSAALARLATARAALEQANVPRGPIGYVGRRSETTGGPTTAASQPEYATTGPAGVPLTSRSSGLSVAPSGPSEGIAGTTTTGAKTLTSSEDSACQWHPGQVTFDWGQLAQYALAPIVVDLAEPGPEPGAGPGAPRAVVLANFADESQPAAYAREHGLEVVKDLGHGLAVLRKPETKSATKPDSKPEPKQGK